MTAEEFAQLKADGYNEMPGNLTGYDCPTCHNKGRVMYVSEDGECRLRDCECLGQRRSMRYLARSGLSQTIETCTWDAWENREPWQEKLYKSARDYAENPEGWFMAAGNPGTGKTHICTAICGEFLRKGKEVRYLLWREFTTQAKAMLTDAEAYQDLVEPVKRVPVLYLDDLFKTGKGQEPTTGDVNLAFELINARYADPKKLTIISTELPISAILDIDEAVGSRIYERAKGHYADLTGRQNWRMK